jgi:hypothetical protein
MNAVGLIKIAEIFFCVCIEREIKINNIKTSAILSL